MVLKQRMSVHVNRFPCLQVDQRLMMSSDFDTLIEGTPTVVVPNETLKSLAAAGLQLIIATDHRGIICSNQNAPHDALLRCSVTLIGLFSIPSLLGGQTTFLRK